MLNIASKARPYFGAIVLTVALLSAGGIYSAMRMPSGVYPEVTFPRIAVVAKKTGLAVPNMEVLVTQPLEQAVSTVIGVAQVRILQMQGPQSGEHDDFREPSFRQAARHFQRPQPRQPLQVF